MTDDREPGGEAEGGVESCDAPDARPKRFVERVWLGGCVALTAIALFYWTSLPASVRFRPPTSPLDNVAGLNETTRFEWAFLWQARDVLPPGATYTIVASDPQIEMSLYMLSLGVLTDCQGFPTSYYQRPSPESGAMARYVLVFGCAAEPAGAELVQTLDDGCIWDRGAR